MPEAGTPAAPPPGTGREKGGRGRETALDGLRGLAATVVVIRHAFNAVTIDPELRRQVLESPLALFLNAQGAVQLFFVLSGYVLAMSLAGGLGGAAVPRFFVRRVFRIHPPYVFAVLFAWCASFFYLQTGAGAGLTPWLRESAAVHIGVGELALALLFPGEASGQLTVGWTLRVELIFSFLLPLLVLIAVRTHAWVLLVVALLGLWLPLSLNVAWYGIDFALGVLAYLHRERLVGLVRALPAPAAAAAGIGALALLCSPMLLGWHSGVLGVLASGFDPLSIVLMAAGSFALIVVVLARPGAGRVLSIPPIRFLGRVSFSLYLLHHTILLLIAPITSRPVNFFVLMPLLLALSLVAAELSYRFVERPSIALGRHLSHRLRRGGGGGTASG
ncbi:MAG: acyltransferase [Deltaproteobacteria bacterium]|nr:acyltransferase [Deltaproteobacteria bacterium]